MTGLLLITDDARRGERLARDLSELERCRIHDLYDVASPACGAGIVLVDVAQLDSDALVRLRRCLAVARGGGVPLVFLAHANAARAEAQARLLDATETLPADTATRMLQGRLAHLSRPTDTKPTLLAVAATKRAELFLRGAFIERPLTLVSAQVGTDLVARAVNEVGIRDWVAAVQNFDNVTHQHILLVAGLAVAFAGALGLGASASYKLSRAALLHDVGKTAIPVAILNKPGRLDGQELQVMRTHAALGHAMLAEGGFDAATLAVARSHHEMLDGSGYPDGLQGGQIPDLVRLVTICDVYAALIEWRPYKPPMPQAEAFGVLTGMVGRLDGDLVRAFQPITAAFGSIAKTT